MTTKNFNWYAASFALIMTAGWLLMTLAITIAIINGLDILKGLMAFMVTTFMSCVAGYIIYDDIKATCNN